MTSRKLTILRLHLRGEEVRMVRHCPRCELRFRNDSELKQHLVFDHGVDPEKLERDQYPPADTR